MEVETIILENGQEYIIFNKKTINNALYVYMVNLNNNKDIIIRKQFKNMLIGLDDEEEFNIALNNMLNNN